MYILTQDGMRIVPFREMDSISIEEDRKFEEEDKAYADGQTVYHIWLYGEIRTVIGSFADELDARAALGQLYRAIRNGCNIAEIPRDPRVEV